MTLLMALLLLMFDYFRKLNELLTDANKFHSTSTAMTREENDKVLNYEGYARSK